MRDNEERLLSIQDVSEFVGLPVSSIYSQRHQGVGIGVLGIRIGRHLRWRLKDIDRWLDEQAERTRDEAHS